MPESFVTLLATSVPGLSYLLFLPLAGVVLIGLMPPNNRVGTWSTQPRPS